MKTIKFHHLLNIPVSYFIKDTNNIPQLPVDKEFQVVACNPKLYLHDEIYEKLSELGTLYSLVFSEKPNTHKGNIHVDLDTKTLEPYWPSLNIVLEGQGIMKWFNPSGKGVIRCNSVGVYFRAWVENYNEPIDEWSTGKIALVRTDTPHQAWNFDDEIRRIVSIRWSNEKSWEETIEWFNRNFPDN